MLTFPLSVYIMKYNVSDYLYLNNGSFKVEVDPYQFNMRLYHLPKFPFNVKKFKKNILSIQLKNARGDANVAVRWCRAGPLSILSLKIWQVCYWLANCLIMLG